MYFEHKFTNSCVISIKKYKKYALRLEHKKPNSYKFDILSLFVFKGKGSKTAEW